MLKKLWLASFAAVLWNSGCAVSVPNIEAVSSVTDIPGVAALGQYTNTDDHRRLTMQEWLDFLYANPSSKKGPAVCISSEAWQKNETALAELCAKYPCSYEQKKTLERMEEFHAEVLRQNSL